MERTFIALIATVLVCGSVATASSQEKAGNASSTLSITEMTPEQFKALPPDAAIDVDGERITKRAFLDRRQAAGERAFKEILESEQAKLEEGNKKAHAEADRLAAVDAAAHGPNWEARKKQAFELLDQAVMASGEQREQLAKRAADLLAPTRP
jgi:hypothetical protein